jgi:adenylate cyclase
MKALIAELRRRNVIKVGIAYAIVAWILIQIVVSVKEPLKLPDWSDTLIIVILAVGFPVALILAWAFERTPEGVRRTPAAEPAAAAAPDDGTSSIAVLPFADMSPQKDQEYFADGITEELLNSLARIKGLRVSGRTSSFYFKGKNEDLRTIGDKLGVRYILEGSVRKSGERVRITAQLIDARSDRHLWSETYDRTLDDLFVIQEQIAKSVADALEITLGVGELGGLPGMTRNAAAYEEYLLAGIANGVDVILPTTIEDLRTGIQHLERAVTIDPDFALAWADINYLYRTSVNLASGGLPNHQEKAAHALQRAITVSPGSPFVLYDFNMADLQDGAWVDAEQHLNEALDAAAAYSVQDLFNFRVAQFLNITGRIREALDYYERVRLADPMNAQSAAYLTDAYLSLGRADMAFAEADRFFAEKGPPVVLVKASALMAAMVTGDKARIAQRLQNLIESESNATISLRMQPLLDDPEGALAELRRMLDDPAFASPFTRNIIAIWAVYFGELQLALTLLREFLLSPRIRNLAFLVWRAIYRDVRRLPEFKGLLRELGLVDYWRQTGRWGDFVRPVGDDDFEVTG